MMACIPWCVGRYTVYGKTFKWENFRGCAQKATNTLFTGELLRYIRPWPSSTVHGK